jgi:uncharacterized surface protein with fasciclin (FAS1) repeats
MIVFRKWLQFVLVAQAISCITITTVNSFRILTHGAKLSSQLFAESAINDKLSTNADQCDLGTFVSDEFPYFYSLLSLNEGLWKRITEADQRCTLFVPSNAVFDGLGEKKLQKLRDNRNLETAQKMGMYHVVEGEAVTAAQLRTEDWTRPAPADGSPRPITVQALLTLGGEVPVGRSKSGGFFLGIGAKEDGDIVIGPNARIINSYKVDGSIVHEVNNLISPLILWRYFDQLRIPGF